MRRSLRSVVVLLAALVVAPAAAAAPGDTARYILPPGNYGGLPTNENSLDQLPLYDALTPLRGNITRQHINDLFLPEDFKPIGQTREEPTGRPGLRLIYDEYGVPHVYGKTRSDTFFGAGYASAQDRLFFMDVLRHTGRARLTELIGPGSGNSTVRMDADQLKVADYSEAELQRMIDEGVERAGAEGRQMRQDLLDYVDGINQYIAEARTDPNKLPGE